VVQGLDAIPERLQLTMNGLNVGEGDERFEEVFVLHAGTRLQPVSNHSKNMNFLAADIAIFASQRNLEIANESRHIVNDGTFGRAPAGTQQIYRIFGFVNGEATPVCTAIMTRKDRVLYAVLWNKCN